MDALTREIVLAVLPALIAGGTVSVLGFAVAKLVVSHQRRRIVQTLLGSATQSFRPWQEDRRDYHKSTETNGRSLAGWIAPKLADADVTTPPATFLTRIVLGALLAAVVLLLVFGQPMAALAGIVAVPALALIWLGRRAAQTRDHLVAQLPTALATVSNSLSAGASLPQAIAQAATELPPPVNGLLVRASHAYSIGQSFEDVLAGIQEKLRLPALEMALAAMLVHRRAGGNLAVLLSDAAEMMREDFRLQRDLRVATAQAKLSAQVVGALPVVLVLLLALVSPDTITPFFSSLLGMLLFSVAAGLETVGYLLVMRASTVKF